MAGENIAEAVKEDELAPVVAVGMGEREEKGTEGAAVDWNEFTRGDAVSRGAGAAGTKVDVKLLATDGG